MHEAALMHIVYSAIADPAFRADLFAHPDRVAEAYALDAATSQMLRNFTPAHLERFVGSLIMHQIAPIRVSARFVIVPEGSDFQAAPPDIPIRLGADLVFGNGTHASTRLCMMALERFCQPGMRVLDVGTGTGLLAIAAAKLGAAEVLALDVDPFAAQAATRHAALNGVGDRIRVEAGSVERAAGFAPDLILANLLAPILIDLAPALAGLAQPDTLLIASGLTASQRRPVAQALRRAGLKTTQFGRDNGWVALRAQRRTRHLITFG